MVTPAVGTMASGGSVGDRAEHQSGKDLVMPLSVPASSLTDSDGDHAGRLDGSSGGGSNRGDISGAARVTTDTTRVSGRVKWFNHHKGFGFITVDHEDGEVFVHQSNIKSDGFRSLWDEEVVEFDLVIGDDGKKKAFNVTGPGGRPPQCAVQMAGYRMSPNMQAGMTTMMASVSGPNPMGSMSPPAQGYPGSTPSGVGMGGGPQGQPNYGQMPRMAYYQQPAFYPLNEMGYSHAYTMSPMSPMSSTQGYYGGRGWYGGPRPPPPGTPGYSSGLQVVVHNLPWDCTWQALKEAFEDIGEIERADVVFDSHGRSRGFGVVRFADRESAQKAVEKMNDKTISGRVVSVRVDRFA